MEAGIQLTQEMVLVLIVLSATIGLFVSELVRVDIAAILVMVVIGLLGLVPSRDLFNGFASNAVISIGYRSRGPDAPVNSGTRTSSKAEKARNAPGIGSGAKSSPSSTSSGSPVRRYWAPSRRTPRSTSRSTPTLS